MDQLATPLSEQSGEPAPNPRRRLSPLGKLSQIERARLAAAEREVEAGKLFADLGGRAPTAAEAALIEQAAALIVDIRAARRAGRSTDDKVRLLTRVVGKLGFQLGSAVKPVFVPLREIMARCRLAARRTSTRSSAGSLTPSSWRSNMPSVR